MDLQYNYRGFDNEKIIRLTKYEVENNSSKLGYIKIQIIILFGLLLTSCSSSVDQNMVLGSWYHFNKSTKEYQEIHIDDSLFIRIYNDASVLLPFDYVLKNDTFYLGVSMGTINKKYKVSPSIFSENKIRIENKNEKLLLIKMDTIIQNLHDTFANYDSLESFSLDYYKRKMIILDEYEKHTLIE